MGRPKVFLVKALAALLLMLCLVVPAGAQGSQIECLETQLTPAQLRRIESGLEWIKAFYGRLGLRPETRIKARIFKTKPEFLEYQAGHRKFSAGGHPTSTGYYSNRDKELVLWTGPGFEAVFLHEAQHSFMRSLYPKVPTWLNEGLSECVEGLNLEGVARLEPQDYRLRKTRGLRSQNFSRTLLQVVGYTRQQFEAGRGPTHGDTYTRAWALVYFLLSRPRGEELIRRLLDGGSLREIYPGGTGELRDNLEEFYRTL